MSTYWIQNQANELDCTLAYVVSRLLTALCSPQATAVPSGPASAEGQESHFEVLTRSEVVVPGLSASQRTLGERIAQRSTTKCLPAFVLSCSTTVRLSNKSTGRQAHNDPDNYLG